MSFVFAKKRFAFLCVLFHIRALSDSPTDCRRSPCPTGGLAAGPRPPAAKRVASARSRACPSPGKTRRQAGGLLAPGRTAKKIKTKLSLSLSRAVLTGGWVERGGVVVAHVAGRPSQRQIFAPLLGRPAQPVTVVTGLLFLLLLPGYFSGLGPVDGAQTAEREKQKCVSLGGEGRGGGVEGVCTLRQIACRPFAYFANFLLLFLSQKKGRRKQIF